MFDCSVWLYDGDMSGQPWAPSFFYLISHLLTGSSSHIIFVKQIYQKTWYRCDIYYDWIWHNLWRKLMISHFVIKIIRFYVWETAPCLIMTYFMTYVSTFQGAIFLIWHSLIMCGDKVECQKSGGWDSWTLHKRQAQKWNLNVLWIYMGVSVSLPDYV